MPRLSLTGLASLCFATGCYSGAPQLMDDGTGAAGDDHGGSEGGAASSQEGGDGTGGEEGDGGGPPPLSCDNTQPGPSPLRRLTRLEYDNTVRDLLGTEAKLGATLPPEERVNGFDNSAVGRSTSLLLAEGYYEAAVALAGEAVGDIWALTQCDLSMNDEATCGERFVAEFGKRAWRRPLTAAEQQRMYGFFTQELGANDYATALEQTVAAFLMSPHFLYRVELGGDPDAPVDASHAPVPLTDHEVATRLSYFLWNTMPDDELLTAADAGALHTPAQVLEQAERMLEDPRALSAIRDFHGQWLELEQLQGVNQDATLFPEFDDTLKPKLVEETELFIEHLITGGGNLHEFLTAEYSYMDRQVAEFYGVPAHSGDTEFVRVDNPGKASGMLTHASLLAVHSSPSQTNPVRRGAFVRERLMCQAIPPPPPDIEVIPPDPDPNATTRERFRQHNEDEACSGCHALMDPLGLGFENYDPVGRYRTLENGFPIDASGEIIAGGDVAGTFNGVRELGTKLAGSEQVRQCFVTQWFRYIYGRERTEADACTFDGLKERFAATDGNLRDLMLAFTQTDAFLFRGSPDDA